MRNMCWPAAALLMVAASWPCCRAEFLLLDPADYRQFFAEGAPCPIPPCGRVNQSSYEWAAANLPLFASDNPDLEAAYYFRAKTYKSHIIQTEFVDAPFVVSEFGPAVHVSVPVQVYIPPCPRARGAGSFPPSLLRC